VLAFGRLLGELLERCAAAAPAGLIDLQRHCTAAQPTARPTMAEAVDSLSTFAPLSSPLD
ncbi:MAG TPA: hypothetical protein VNZ85_19920, partial [Caulobacter sp.]|nr:hypothetical protein [Caulobacter sp.]